MMESYSNFGTFGSPWGGASFVPIQGGGYGSPMPRTQTPLEAQTPIAATTPPLNLQQRQAALAAQTQELLAANPRQELRTPRTEAVYNISNGGFEFGTLLDKKTNAWAAIHLTGLLNENLPQLNKAYQAALPTALSSLPATNPTPYHSLLGLQDKTFSWQEMKEGSLKPHAKAQLQGMAQQSKEAVKSVIHKPSTLLSGLARWGHAGFVAPFQNLLSGQGGVLSNTLTSATTLLLGWNVLHRTQEAHEDAKNEGETGWQLAATTSLEGAKEAGKAAAVWVAGDVGSTLAKSFFKVEAPSLGRFKSLPWRSASFAGAVAVGLGVNWVLEQLFPRRICLQKATPTDGSHPA